MEEEDRGRVWRLYGWYSGLMACGSCVGAVTWAAQMISYVYSFEADSRPNLNAEYLSLSASERSWYAVFLVTYGIEFLCLSAAKLMVLDRMSVFAAPQGIGMRRRWAAAGRVVMAVVVLGNAVGLAANAVAAVHYNKAAQAYSSASLEFAANNTEDGDEFNLRGVQEVTRADYIASVQSFCEVAVLLLIVVAFVVVGVMSARRVSNSIKLLRAGNFSNTGAAVTTGRALRLQIVCTTAFVFVAFLVRSAFSIMYAIANHLQDLDKICPERECDASCHNVYTHVAEWMDHTPEFEALIVLVSSPIALLVALWGMTTKTMLNILRSGPKKKQFSLEHVDANKKESSSPAPI